MTGFGILPAKFRVQSIFLGDMTFISHQELGIVQYRYIIKNIDTIIYCSKLSYAECLTENRLS
jgi:hypothetical protein